MELPAGVHDLSLSYARGENTMTIHPVAIETDRGVLLVDVGFDRGVLEAGLQDCGIDPQSVCGIIATHQDGDHVAALADVVDEINVPVLAHTEATPYIDGRKDPIKGDRRGDPTAVDMELVEGVGFRTNAGRMQVLFTPGHSPGHISLYLPEHRTLLAADALTADGNTLAGPNPSFTPDQERALESVSQLAELTVDTVVCYHGGIVEPATGAIARIAKGH